MKGNQSISQITIPEVLKDYNFLDNPSQCHKCSIDLMPKLIWNQSITIDTLIKSGVSRYLEFKTIENIYLNIENKLENVPVSKAEIFNSKSISLVEKRYLMKFITEIIENNESEQNLIENFEDKPLIEFLIHKQLSSKLQSFILYALALETKSETSSERMKTKQGIEKIKNFVMSLGRFKANSPWLYPLFGLGDLSQSFCRLSAVYGTIFILDSYVNGLNLQISDSKLEIESIQVGQTNQLKCKYLISNLDHVPELIKPVNNTDHSISRCILILNQPLNVFIENMLTIIPPNTFKNKETAYILQLYEGSSCVPHDMFLFHIWTNSNSNNPQDDLQDLVSTLLSSQENLKTHYIAYFKKHFLSINPLIRIPENLFLVPDSSQIEISVE